MEGNTEGGSQVEVESFDAGSTVWHPDVVHRTKPVIITRDEWGAEPAREKKANKFPLMRVFFTLYTETPPCHNKEDCINTVKELQRRHMEELGLSDIKFNFLVGGDGNIYEGRGWSVRSSKSLEFNPAFYGHRVDIAYIGDFRNVPHPPYLQLEEGINLVSYGEYLKKIHETRSLFQLQGDKGTDWDGVWLSNWVEP